MIFFFSSLVLLLYDTVLANGCSHMYKSEQLVRFDTSSAQQQSGHGVAMCVFFFDAPRNHYVMLNFTNFFSPKVNLGKADSSCMPKLSILEVMDSGVERNSNTLCGAPNTVNPPKVFQLSTHFVKLIYIWDTSDSVNSGFTAQLRFLKWPSGACKFKCRSGSCLPESNLVCNGINNCEDGSDELQCDKPPVSTASTEPSGNGFIEKIIIVIVVVVTLAVIAGVVLNYRSGPFWGERHRHLSNSSDGTALHSHTPPTTEVVYVPGSSDSHLVGGERDRQVRLYSPSRQPDINLPPHIARSEDGEEGYALSQRLLQADILHSEVESEAIRPPPNRTVFQGESPPPYHVQPNGKACSRHPPRKVDCSCGMPPLAYPNNNDVHPPGSIPYTPAAGPRTTAASCSARAGLGNYPHDNLAPRARGHSRRGGDAASAGSHSDNSCQSNQRNGAPYGPPPDYSEVVPLPGSQEQRGLPSNSNSMSNSNV